MPIYPWLPSLSDLLFSTSLLASRCASRGPVDLDNPPTGRLVSETGVSAAAHNDAVHAFGVGVGPPFPVTHARTFTGASWTIDLVGKFDLAPTGPPESVASLPVSAVSYDDHLYVFGILKDHSIQTLAYTVDGGSWVQQATGPGGLRTTEPITTAAFRHRLYLLARDSGTNHLRMTSTADLDTFNPWVDVLEPAGFPPVSSVAAEPLDVAAGIFRDRIYLATRWKPTNHIALNFSEDGANWSGWRIPQFDVDPAFDPADLQFGATAALAPVGNHLYIFAPTLDENQDFQHIVWVY